MAEALDIVAQGKVKSFYSIRDLTEVNESVHPYCCDPIERLLTAPTSVMAEMKTGRVTGKVVLKI